MLLWGIIGMICMAGFFLYQSDDPREMDTNGSIRQTGYDFINPLLECEMQNKTERQKYIPFEDITINRINTEVIKKYPNVKVGVYVRNLNNGPWFGINENEYYSPASILKVPVLITYLKWIEKDQTIWDKKLYLGQDESYDHYFPPSKNLTPNQEYSVRELLTEMIVHSDNKSLWALTKAIPIDLYKQVNQDLGITVPGIKTPEDFLSVKDIATFFRILYNASYLERESSEYALKLLSQVDFNNGLRAWVPLSITISHKFGERGYNDIKTGKYIRQLHDCGIIYYKKYPYLACIVTKGDNFDENASIIANTSKIIFEEISKAFPEK
jgi:beta-lactamase class A